MNLDDAFRFTEAAGVARADLVPFLVYAGAYAALPALLERVAGPFDPVPDPIASLPVVPLRAWRDPVEALPDVIDRAHADFPKGWGYPCRLALQDAVAPDMMAQFVEDRSLVLSITNTGGPTARPLDWPLRIDVPDAASDALMDRGWSQRLIKRVNGAKKGARPHFVFGGEDYLADWQARAAETASMAVLFGAGAVSLPTGGVAVLSELDNAGIGHFAQVFVEVLSHNETVDVALYAAAEASGLPAPEIIARPDWLEANRLSRIIRAEGLRQRHLSSLGSYRTERSRALAADTAGSAPPVDDLLDGFRDRPFMAESAEASEASEALTALRAESRDREDRFLTADVETEDDSARLTVWIAPLAEAGPAIAPDAFPDDTLDWEDTMLALDVVLFELKDGGQALRETITLGREGPSSKVAFDLDWSGARFDARIIVLHNHRFVQSMLVTIPAGGGRVSLKREALIRAIEPDLVDATPAGSAITLNDFGGPLIAVATPGGAEIHAPTGLNEARQSITNLLMTVIDDPDAFTSLAAPAYQKLLVQLARHGTTLRDTLFTGRATAVAPEIYEAIQAADSISVLSAKPTHVLPLEFIYEPTLSYPFGTQPTVCAHAAQALSRPDADFTALRGVCAKHSDSPGCGASDAEVCPLGFWGMTKVIERHVNRRHPVAIQRDYAISSSPSDARPHVDIRRLLAAATPKADNNPSAAWSTTLDALIAELGDDLQIGTDWASVIGHVNGAATAPGMVILLPHVEKDRASGESLLDIGAAPHLWLHNISNHMAGMGATSPLVLLLGCATGPGDNPMEEFPGRFLDAGAAAILATMTLVRGRFVAEIAEQAALLTRQIIAKDGSARLGETVLRLRQALLGRNPFVLSLAAYGDADWLFILSDDPS